MEAFLGRALVNKPTWLGHNQFDYLIEDKAKIQKWLLKWSASPIKDIYNRIDHDIQLSPLPDRSIRRHRAKETRGTFSHGRSIEERTRKVKTRKTFGLALRLTRLVW